MKRLFKRLPVDPFTHGERVNQVFASIHADGGTLSEEGDFVEASYDEGTGEVFSVQG